MGEPARAIQTGALAFLNRQYTTIGIVGVILFLVIGFVPGLGWATAWGFALGSILSGATGYIGMNISVRANVRTAEAARVGLNEALTLAFRGGSITGLLVVGLGLLGVAGYYAIMAGSAAPRAAGRDVIKPLVGLGFGGGALSFFAAVGGRVFLQKRRGGGELIVAGVLAAIAFVPVTYWIMGGVVKEAPFEILGNRQLITVWHLWGAALVGLVLTALMVVITEYYTATEYSPVRHVAQASTTGHATNIIAGLGVSMRATAWPVIAVCAALWVAYNLAGLY